MLIPIRDDEDNNVWWVVNEDTFNTVYGPYDNKDAAMNKIAAHEDDYEI